MNIPVVSPTFVQPFYHHEHVHLRWSEAQPGIIIDTLCYDIDFLIRRLRLERLSKDVAPEDSDLRLYVDLVRPPDALFDATPHEFAFYGRAHNPSSYSWSEFKSTTQASWDPSFCSFISKFSLNSILFRHKSFYVVDSILSYCT